MKCETNIGALWDNTNEVLVDWDKRTQCPNDATWTYNYGLAALKNCKTHLCDEHKEKWESYGFLGTIVKANE